MDELYYYCHSLLSGYFKQIAIVGWPQVDIRFRVGLHYSIRYDDFESGAIELLKLLYLNQIGDAILLDEPHKVLGGFQLRLSCCGVWSYTDYVTNSNLHLDGVSLALDALTSDSLTLPSSCCPSS